MADQDASNHVTAAPRGGYVHLVLGSWSVEITPEVALVAAERLLTAADEALSQRGLVNDNVEGGQRLGPG
ncbi:MAG: hypothetical protein JWO33_2272 [Caulobacteraceae bacterium]|nr:hypothetical protein [Caulobacteraceae bacterium]